MTSAWLEPERFALRHHLGAIQRELRPLAHTTPLGAGMGEAVAARWAAQMHWPDRPVEADEVVLCGSAREAAALALATLLKPGDVLLLAHPCEACAPAIALGQGAAFVDVGRCVDGTVDRLAAERAAAAHPGAVVWASAPAYTAADDTLVWQGVSRIRALVCDMQRALWPSSLPAASACLVALRDPDQPADAVLHAVVADRSAAHTLQAIWGPAQVPTGQLRHAYAVLSGWQADGTWPAATRSAIAAEGERLGQLARAWPGAAVYLTGGASLAIACRAGDPAELGKRLRQETPVLAAYGAHPMRNLLVVDLAAGGALCQRQIAPLV